MFYTSASRIRWMRFSTVVMSSRQSRSMRGLRAIATYGAFPELLWLYPDRNTASCNSPADCRITQDHDSAAGQLALLTSTTMEARFAMQHQDRISRRDTLAIATGGLATACGLGGAFAQATKWVPPAQQSY
jgi:hypothetical protein